MRILLMEADKISSDRTTTMLTGAGFTVYATGSGDDGIELAKLYDYDLVLLAMNLPDTSGYEVMRQLRSANVVAPVVCISKNYAVAAKVKMLALGADDYLTKPIHCDELVARIHAIVRRANGYAQSSIVTGRLRVNLYTKTAEVDGNPLHVTGKEYQLLELLTLHKGATLTREIFMMHLYGGMDEPEIKIVDVFVSKLRKKLRAATGDGTSYIYTTWGRGYVMRDPAPACATPQPNTATGVRQ